MVSSYVGNFRKNGIVGLEKKSGGGRPPKLTFEEEESILDEFKEKAEAGQIIEVSEIKAKYVNIAGSSKSYGQIYAVLHRHNWRKIKPRSKHPNKADKDTISSSKKD